MGFVLITGHLMMCKQLIIYTVSKNVLFFFSFLLSFLEASHGQCVLSIWRGYALGK